MLSGIVFNSVGKPLTERVDMIMKGCKAGRFKLIETCMGTTQTHYALCLSLPLGDLLALLCILVYECFGRLSFVRDGAWEPIPHISNTFYVSIEVRLFFCVKCPNFNLVQFISNASVLMLLVVHGSCSSSGMMLNRWLHGNQWKRSIDCLLGLIS